MNDLVTDIAQILVRHNINNEFKRAAYMVEQMQGRFDQPENHKLMLADIDAADEDD